MNHVTCLVNHVTSFVEMTSEAAFFRAGRSADALKAEKPGPVRSNGADLKSVPKNSEEVGGSVDEFLPFVIKPGNLKQ